MMSDHFSSHDQDQLFARAFSYVAGELGEEDRRQFEALLADNAEAQQAVVTAISLSRTVNRVFAGVDTEADQKSSQFANMERDGLRSHRWTQTIAPAAVFALAAALMGAALFFVLPMSDRPPLTRADSQGHYSYVNSISDVWIDTVSLWDWDDAIPVSLISASESWPLLEDDADVDSPHVADNPVDEFDDSDESDEEIPWMVVAAELEAPSGNR